jgi:hypothetical protein
VESILKLRLLALLFCSVIFMSSEAFAKPSVTVRVGYEGQGLEGAWIPVHAEVILPIEDPPFKGRIEVPGDRKCRPAIYASPLELAPGSKKKICLFIPSRLAANRSLRLVSSKGVVVGTEPLPTLQLLNPVRDPLILIVSGSAGGLVALRSSTASGKHGPRLADLTLNELPSRSWALDAVSLIVLRDLAELPSADQLEAVRKYVERGGVLLVIGGGRPFWKAKEYRELLPDALGNEKTYADERALGYFGLDKGRLPPMFQFLKKRSGTLYVPPGSNTPFFAQRSLGAGMVVFSAFDPDAPGVRTLGRLPTVLKSLLDLNHYQMGPSSPHRNSLGTLMRKRSERLFWEKPLQSPTVLLLALLLTTIYVVMVAKGIPVLQRRRPDIPLLVIVPPLAVLFAIGLMLWAQFLRPETAVRGFSYEVVSGTRVDGKQRGRRIVDLGFYAGDSTELSMTLKRHFSPSKRLMLGFENIMNPFTGTRFEQRLGESTKLSPISLNASGFTWLRLENTRMRKVPLEAFQFEQPEGLRVRLRNTGTKTLHNLAVYLPGTKTPGRIFFVNKLEPDRDMLIKGGDLMEGTLQYYVGLGDFWTLTPENQSKRLLIETLTEFKDYYPQALSGGLRKQGEVAWVAYLEEPDWPCEFDVKGQEKSTPISGGQVVILGTEDE